MMKGSLSVPSLIIAILLLAVSTGNALAQTRVAVVGDSIVQGYGGVSPWWQTLANRLGGNYQVQGFGQAGVTVLPFGQSPFITSGVYFDSLNYQPDIVLLLLGANDGKTDTWTGSNTFAENYDAILEAYEAIPSAPEVWVITPLPVAGEGNFGIQPDIVNNGVIPAVRTLVAAKASGGLIEVAEDFDLEGGLLDNIHPTTSGANYLAEQVAASNAFRRSSGGGGSGGGQTEDLGNGWAWSADFGFFWEDSSTPWIFHERLGWLWPFGDLTRGWFYSSLYRDLIWVDGRENGDYFYLEDSNRWQKWR